MKEEGGGMMDEGGGVRKEDERLNVQMIELFQLTRDFQVIKSSK